MLHDTRSNNLPGGEIRRLLQGTIGREEDMKRALGQEIEYFDVVLNRNVNRWRDRSLRLGRDGQDQHGRLNRRNQ